MKMIFKRLRLLKKFKDRGCLNMKSKDMKVFSFNLNDAEFRVSCVVNSSLKDKEIFITNLDSENKKLEVLIESKRIDDIDLDFQNFIDEIMEEIKIYDSLNTDSKEKNILEIFNSR